MFNKLILVRHAESVGQILSAEEMQKAKSHDWELSEKGKADALKMRNWFNEFTGEIDIYLSSNLRRAKETIELLFPETAYTTTPLLNEVGTCPEAVYCANSEHFTCMSELARIQTFFNSLAEFAEGKNVFALTHCNWISNGVGLLRPYTSMPGSFQLPSIENLSATLLEQSPGGQKTLKPPHIFNVLG